MYARGSRAASEAAADLASRFRAVRSTTDCLCAPLTPEDCQVQSMEEASPAKWHMAHTSWFFETFVLARRIAGYEPFHPDFAFLYNSYYNAVGAQYPRARRGLVTRPGLDEVRRYRAHVDVKLASLIDKGPEELGAAAAVVELGLNHEQQHQELLLTDLKHALSMSPLEAAYLDAPAPQADGEAPPLSWQALEGGLVDIGHAGDGFAFDNEGPRHRVHLTPFELASRLVTCGEYLQFIEDGGYRRPELWLSDGWALVAREGWRAPLYWAQDSGVWSVFTLSGRRALHPAEPVCHVSYYEADACARWFGARLPTEQEWESAAAARPVAGHFAETGRLHPRPAPGPGLEQLYGDVWEWTSSPYIAYPGYRPPAGALGEYNGKFMCNQLVLRGGSCLTPASHLRPTYRNFFHPPARWQMTGLRLARDLA